MEAARILEEEHKVILTVLDVLQQVIVRLRKDEPFPADDARAIIRFFVEFADKCHHAKEEDTLFPVMEANGFPRDSGPTAVMRHEHAVGRKLVGAMKDVLEAAIAGDAGAVADFAARGDEFIELLGGHIRKEDHCLFPMACNAIRNPDHQCDLALRFRQIEADAGGRRHHEFLAAAAELCRRYGITPVDADQLPVIKAAFGV